MLLLVNLDFLGFSQKNGFFIILNGIQGFKGFQGDRTDRTVLHANFQPIWWYKTSKSPLFYILADLVVQDIFNWTNRCLSDLVWPHGVPGPMGPTRKAPKKGPKKGAQKKGTIFIDGYPSMNSLMDIHQ